MLATGCSAPGNPARADVLRAAAALDRPDARPAAVLSGPQHGVPASRALPPRRPALARAGRPMRLPRAGLEATPPRRESENGTPTGPAITLVDRPGGLLGSLNLDILWGDANLGIVDLAPQDPASYAAPESPVGVRVFLRLAF